jgi:hypothetical protein
VRRTNIVLLSLLGAAAEKDYQSANGCSPSRPM